MIISYIYNFIPLTYDPKFPLKNKIIDDYYYNIPIYY